MVQLFNHNVYLRSRRAKEQYAYECIRIKRPTCDNVEPMIKRRSKKNIKCEYNMRNDDHLCKCGNGKTLENAIYLVNNNNYCRCCVSIGDATFDNMKFIHIFKIMISNSWVNNTGVRQFGNIDFS